jgi:hypothetical protein
MLHTYIKYHSADPCNTYIMYNPADVRWYVLSDIMSHYYLRYCQVFGLNGVSIALWRGFGELIWS